MNEHPHMIVADPLAAYEKESMVKLVAPAKVNLFLGVGDKRADGYHDVATVMHALSLHDILHMDHAPSSEGGLRIEVACQAREGLEELDVLAEDNIAAKAVRLLAAKLGREQDETMSIRIEKHIPHEAGLGGGSSDAAAALLGAANLWGEADSASEVAAAARELGADVPFFLQGGCAFMSGVGDTFERAFEPMSTSLVLVRPEMGVPTVQAYEVFDALEEVLDTDMLEKVKRMQSAADVPLYNNLTQAAERIAPELSRIRSWLEAFSGTKGVLLSGSGSTTFALCESFAAAHHLSCEAKKQGWWARASSLSPLRAALFPRKTP